MVRTAALILGLALMVPTHSLEAAKKPKNYAKCIKSTGGGPLDRETVISTKSCHYEYTGATYEVSPHFEAVRRAGEAEWTVLLILAVDYENSSLLSTKIYDGPARFNETNLLIDGKRFDTKGNDTKIDFDGCAAKKSLGVRWTDCSYSERVAIILSGDLGAAFQTAQADAADGKIFSPNYTEGATFKLILPEYRALMAAIPAG